VSWFLELAEELALFGKITLCSFAVATAHELRTFSSSVWFRKRHRIDE